MSLKLLFSTPLTGVFAAESDPGCGPTLLITSLACPSRDWVGGLFMPGDPPDWSRPFWIPFSSPFRRLLLAGPGHQQLQALGRHLPVLVELRLGELRLVHGRF